MTEKLKKYIEECYLRTERAYKVFKQPRYVIDNGRAQAFGALMFCEEFGLVKYEDIASYWDDAWNRFQALYEVEA